MINDAFVQLGIGRKGDVLLLDRGVHQNFPLLRLSTMKCYGYLKDFLHPFFTDPLSEIDKIRGMTGKFPLKRSFSSKELESKDSQSTALPRIHLRGCRAVLG